MKICERCGDDFTCSAEKPAQQPCWCKNMGALTPIPKQYKDCLCPECLKLFLVSAPQLTDGLKEGDDFYLERGLMVFTSRYLKNRGYCCNSGCRHCPYAEG
jgi:hypothetical protein